MNPFIKKSLGSVLTVIVTALVTWLISTGFVPPESAQQVVELLVGVGLIAAQRVWKKNDDQKVLNVALGSDFKQSESEAKAKVKAGVAPDVSTAVHDVPVLKPEA